MEMLLKYKKDKAEKDGKPIDGKNDDGKLKFPIEEFIKNNM